jgi:hypothetical protein
MLLSAFAGFTPVLAFAAAVCCLATALAFAGVLAFAAVVSGLTAALALTIVLTFARVLPCIGVDEVMNGSACYMGSARGIRSHCNGTGEEPGNCRSGDDRFRWFHGTISFRDLGLDLLGFVRQESTEAWFLPFPARDFLCQSKEGEIEWGETWVR